MTCSVTSRSAVGSARTCKVCCCPMIGTRPDRTGRCGTGCPSPSRRGAATAILLSESGWDAEALNARRVDLVLHDPVTTSHDRGVLVIDDTGDRKKGSHTQHVGRQYLGSVGKIDNGIVAVSSLWADERVYYPLHVVPFTPGRWFPKATRIRPPAPSRNWPCS